MKKRVAVCAEYSDEEKAALLQEMPKLERAREMAVFIGAQRESLKGFCNKWLHDADLIERDLRFLLSGEARPDLHRFAAFVGRAGALCSEIEKAGKLFEVTLPGGSSDAREAEKEPAHSVAQLALFA